jgi:hypothetical protein
MGLQQDGLESIFLRKLCKTELYLRLMVSGRVLLEIASIRYINRYPGIRDNMGKRKSWISFEILKSLFMGFKKYGDSFIQPVKKSLTNPYRSTRVFMGKFKELNSE